MENKNTELATLGGGCFWCLEAVYEQVKGVDKVVSGYSGGSLENPTYEQVCSETTGHAEVVQVTFNTEIISYDKILRIFFAIAEGYHQNYYQNNKYQPYCQGIISPKLAKFRKEYLSDLKSGN